MDEERKPAEEFQLLAEMKHFIDFYLDPVSIIPGKFYGTALPGGPNSFLILLMTPSVPCNLD